MAVFLPAAEMMPASDRISEIGLVVRQEPIKGRFCHNRTRESRVVDPPPVVQLTVQSEGLEINLQQSPGLFMVADLFQLQPVSRPVSPVVSRRNMRRTSSPEVPRKAVAASENLGGTLVSTIWKLHDLQHRVCGFFIFPDLQVHEEGIFRLRFSLFEVTDRRGPAVHPSHGATEVVYLTNTWSQPFRVYGLRDYPGDVISPPLLLSFVEQGFRCKVRRDSDKVAGPEKESGGKGRARSKSQPQPVQIAMAQPPPIPAALAVPASIAGTAGLAQARSRDPRSPLVIRTERGPPPPPLSTSSYQQQHYHPYPARATTITSPYASHTSPSYPSNASTSAGSGRSSWPTSADVYPSPRGSAPSPGLAYDSRSYGYTVLGERNDAYTPGAWHANPQAAAQRYDAAAASSGPASAPATYRDPWTARPPPFPGQGANAAYQHPLLPMPRYEDAPSREGAGHPASSAFGSRTPLPPLSSQALRVSPQMTMRSGMEMGPPLRPALLHRSSSESGPLPPMAAMRPMHRDRGPTLSAPSNLIQGQQTSWMQSPTPVSEMASLQLPPLRFPDQPQL